MIFDLYAAWVFFLSNGLMGIPFFNWKRVRRRILAWLKRSFWHPSGNVNLAVGILGRSQVWRQELRVICT